MRLEKNFKNETNKPVLSSGIDIGSAWVMFMVFPIIVLYKAVRNFHIPNYRKFIVIFGVLYGTTFIPITDSDGDRYGQSFKAQREYSFAQYMYDITHIYDKDTKYPDVYAFSLFFFLGKISNNSQLFYAFTSLIYFLVFIALLASVYDSSKHAGGKGIKWFFVGLVFIVNLSSGMNGVRWPLALMVFLFYSFKLLTKGNIKYLWLAGLSVFIHFAILYAFLFLIVYYISVKYYRPVYVYVFLGISILAGFIFLNVIQENIAFFGGAYEDRVMGYTGNELFKLNRESHVGRWNWYVQLNLFSKRTFPLIVLIIIAVFRRTLRYDQTARNLEYFAYLMMGASMISGEFIDSISNRYSNISLGITLIFLYYLSCLNNKNIILQRLKYGYIPLLVLQILITLRGDLYTVSPILLIGNPVIMVFVQMQESIQTIILGK